MTSLRLSKKGPHEDRRMTMTAIHKNKIQEFEEQIQKLPEKELILEQYKVKYKITRNSNELFYLKKSIDELEKEIYNIRNKVDYSEYLLKSMSYIDEYKNSELNSNKGQLSKNFLQECFSESLVESTNNDILVCSDCGSNRIIDKIEAMAICSDCGTAVNYQDSELCAEFCDEIEVLSPFSYRRINHFKEWISMLLARESSSPPDDVIDKLLEELRKNRIYDKEKITHERIREYLRKLGLNKMYEHIPLIIHKICGTTPPKISRELENKLIKMFEEIQVPFEKNKPESRSNFLSYSYVLYKFCQLLGENHLLSSLSLLKSREKLYVQEKIFKLICLDLNWVFIPVI